MHMFKVRISRNRSGYSARCDVLDIAVIDKPDKKLAIDAIRDYIADIKPHLDAGTML